MNFEWFKKHPYIYSGVGLALFVVVYLVSKSSSGGSSSSAASTGQFGLSSSDLSYLQLQAASSAQQQQVAAQVQVAQIQAGVANNQTSAAATTTQDQLAAQLAAIQAQTAASVTENATNSATQLAGLESNNSTQVQIANIGANAQTTEASLMAQENETQTNALASIEENQTNAQVSEQANTLSYLGGVATLQAGLQSQGMAEQTQLNSQYLTSQAANEQTVLGLVGKAGLNHGTTSLENDLTQITESTLGQTAPAVANAQSSASEVAAGTLNNPLNTLAASAGSVLSGLFSL